MTGFDSVHGYGGGWVFGRLEIGVVENLGYGGVCLCGEERLGVKVFEVN